VNWIGHSALQFGTVPLPFDLTQLGAPGCSWLVNMLSPPMPFAFDGSGEATVNYNVPYDLTLRGSLVLLQTLALDPRANGLGLTMSNGLAAGIGHGSLSGIACQVFDPQPSSTIGTMTDRVHVVRFRHQPQ
jgi:hypothetical protein